MSDDLSDAQLTNMQSPKTIVSAQPYILHRQENIFPNPETFNPDRWLVDKDSLRPMLKSLLTFSSGPRVCIGKELALAGMQIFNSRHCVLFLTCPGQQ